MPYAKNTHLWKVTCGKKRQINIFLGEGIHCKRGSINVIAVREFDKRNKISFQSPGSGYCNENKLHISMYILK